MDPTSSKRFRGNDDGPWQDVLQCGITEICKTNKNASEYIERVDMHEESQRWREKGWQFLGSMTLCTITNTNTIITLGVRAQKDKCSREARVGHRYEVLIVGSARRQTH